ncbi:MAG: zinc ribbon domain-containing protein, partial [Acidobacteriota bacterium]
RTRWYLSYKAEAHGMRWVLQDEAYTSQTCPSCGRRKPVNGRVYRCSCGFVGHRDHVGAVNILTKYLGCVPVAGLMARPTGWHYQAHARVARGFELREAARL